MPDSLWLESPGNHRLCSQTSPDGRVEVVSGVRAAMGCEVFTLQDYNHHSIISNIMLLLDGGFKLWFG